MIPSGPTRSTLRTSVALLLALVAAWAPLAGSAAAQDHDDGHAAADTHDGGHDAGGHDAHGDVDRTGDASLFTELFSHLVPHAVTGVWIGGDKGFGLVDPYVLDAHGQPVEGGHGPEVYHSSGEFTEARQASFGGGTGILIYNINTAMWLAALLLVLAFLPVAGKARKLAGQAPRGAYYGLMESLFLFVRDEMVYGVLGKEHGRRFVPLFLTQFFFILFMNLMGLHPFFGGLGGTATANLAVTGGLAFTTLLWIHMSGIREHGFGHHWKNFIPHGLPWFVLPIIIPVEILGIIVKPAALTIRLFANLTAGHLIVLGLFGLVYFFGSAVIAVPVMGMGIAIYCLELFVCFVQAYIFTYLSIVFLGASLHPDH